MDFIDSARVGSLLCLILLIIIDATCSREDFVSIQCCAPSDSIDPKTSISWISDSNLTHINGRCLIFDRPVSNEISYKGDRIFETVPKWCYNLTTRNGQDYLIRGTFLNGLNVRNSYPADSTFAVTVGTTSIAQVNSSDDKSEVEGVFRATNHYIDFCLVKDKGSPYISMLELRPLNDSAYLEGNSSVILKLVQRVDVGNTQQKIRYPDDDRIWNTDANPNNYSIQSNNTAIYGTQNTFVPLEVLQTAATAMEQLNFSISLEASEKEYMILLYFLELNSSVTMGERVFNININGVMVHDRFDILQNSSNYKQVVIKVKANESLDISLIRVSADVSALGPICNAYEVFKVQNRTPGTVQEDVDTIVEVRDELLAANPDNVVLRSWSGDPCVPFPLKGLACEPRNSTFVITKLNVRNNRLVGSIPESFANLQHLINLSYGCNPQLDSRLPPGLSNRSNLITEFGDCVDQDSQHPLPQRRTVIIGTIAGGSVLFTIAIGVVFTYVYRHIRPNVTKHAMAKNAVFSMPSMDDFKLSPICIQIFSLQCIETATCKYKTMIGEGGFGSVYRGTLLHGQEVAVKVRSATSTQGTREFENELNLLSAIQHENLVPLLGYCCENDQQILVYPFMSNGSLQDRLYGEAAKRKPLDWQTRLSIALGAARGLLYLHSFAGRCVIHRDVKSSNILLDHSMCAKVADFGFSKYAPQEGDSGVSLEVRGTAGYLDPEYYSTQQLSAKSDVFSFGVVLLEIISGREPLNIHRPRNEWSLVEWAKTFIREARIEEIVDPTIKAGYHAEAMWRVVEVALACIETFSAYRPCMDDIVRELEDAFIIENNASEYMKSIESLGGSNHFLSVERKILPSVTTPTPSEPSPIFFQAMDPPSPR
ncbi:Protein kinase domain-containing protein [Cinnamomum micranthum f. kanehirae]|uniref:Protein kinase domain-containing protein n=1 Tax=Cinnamomum micranthum f. kanehirae TaxID=337451 RepID=A0A3S3Q3A0_9MAGN|nr:Protein kinase domain-containing protein [Cinnamomum micranthum f. kanehirae]